MRKSFIYVALIIIGLVLGKYMILILNYLINLFISKFDNIIIGLIVNWLSSSSKK